MKISWWQFGRALGASHVPAPFEPNGPSVTGAHCATMKLRKELQRQDGGRAWWSASYNPASHPRPQGLPP
jgi:hypothetical protein